MRIRFLRNEVYRAGNCPSFKAGEVVDEADLRKLLALDEAPTDEFARAWLNRWVQRGAAKWDDVFEPVAVVSGSLAGVGLMTEAEVRQLEDLNATADEPKKRGRPAGSKNKPKAED